jgi:hypothetical protein
VSVELFSAGVSFGVSGDIDEFSCSGFCSPSLSPSLGKCFEFLILVFVVKNGEYF